MNVTAHLVVLQLLFAPGLAGAVALKKIPAALDPAKAYILVEYKRVPNPLAGVPFSAKYMPQMGGLALGRYDTTLGDIRGHTSAGATPVPTKTSATEHFQNRPVAKVETALLFLHEVEPDTYVVQGWAGTSFSLGSYTFEAKAGSIVDLGVVSAAVDWPAGEAPRFTAGRFAEIVLAGPFAKASPVAPSRVAFRPRGEGDMPLPAGLPVERIIPVSFKSGATFGNYLGGPVNRIEGVNAGAAITATPDPVSRP